MNLLLFYLFLALVVSFICSMVEAVLLTIPQSYLVSVRSQSSWANSFLSFKKNIDKPLSAILTLNTIAHTIGAAGVGAQVTTLYGDSFLGTTLINAREIGQILTQGKFSDSIKNIKNNLKGLNLFEQAKKDKTRASELAIEELLKMFTK